MRTLILRALLVPGILAALLLAPAAPGTAAPLGSAGTAASQVAGTAATGIPSSCSSSTYLWANLAACGRFGRTNTGPYLANCPGHKLVPMGSSVGSTIALRTRGQSLECRDVKGCLSVQAANVKITNVQVRCTSGRTGTAANATAAIKIEPGASVDMHRVRIDGLKGVHACIWHEGARASMNRIDCTGANDGVFSWGRPGKSDGGQFSLTNSYLHDFTTRTANGHVDGYQTEGAANGLIRGNTFLMTTDSGSTKANSAIAIWDSLRDSSDFTVTRNLISGGGFSVYAHDYSPSEAHPAGGYSVRRVSLTDNTFSQKLFGCVGQWGVWFPRGAPTDGWNRSGNRVLETGASVDRANPVYHGATCN